MSNIATRLISPPQRLIKNAVMPRVMPAKADFISTMNKASDMLSVDTANIVTILDSPGFAPGGKNGKAGRSDSSHDSANASAPSIPARATLRAGFFLSVNEGIYFFFSSVFNGYNCFCR